jgi:hypothetical protein
MCVRLAR